MKKQEENLTGKKFGKLTVMKQISATSCLCRCECGNKRTVYINSLLKGHVRSCGCLYRQSTRQAIAAKNKNMVEVIKKH